MSVIMEKNPWIALEGLSKTYFFMQFSLERQLFKPPRDFAGYANGNIKDIACIYISHKNIPDEPKEIESTRYVKEISALQVHMVKRLKTKVFYL